VDNNSRSPSDVLWRATQAKREDVAVVRRVPPIFFFFFFVETA